MRNQVIAIHLVGQLKSQEAQSASEKTIRQEEEYYLSREVPYALASINKPRSRALIEEATNHKLLLVQRMAVNLAEAR